MDKKEFEIIKQDFKKKEQIYNEETGKYKAFLENLKEMGFKDREEGKQYYKQLKKDLESIEKKKKKLIKAFKKKYGKELKSIGNSKRDN